MSTLYFKVFLKSGEELLLEIRYRHSAQVDALPLQLQSFASSVYIYRVELNTLWNCPPLPYHK